MSNYTKRARTLLTCEDSNRKFDLRLVANHAHCFHTATVIGEENLCAPCVFCVCVSVRVRARVLWVENLENG